ncbi:MAG: hypothetical protein IT366_09825 [Candidatus Hydrogenedentes bacterium]|nr:hypothetical protein [Candidatus Hydrogenedentota bacterium]
MLVRERRGKFWELVHRLWKFVTPISLQIGIVPSLIGGVVLMLLGWVIPGLLAFSIPLMLLGYIVGAGVFILGVFLFARGII